MSKLYSADEGYQVKLNRGTIRGRKKLAEKSPKAVTSPYTTIRDEMEGMLSDRDPDGSISRGPPYPKEINLSALGHDDFVEHARKVQTEENPNGRPPGGLGHTMSDLIRQLDIEMATKEEITYASVTNPLKKKQSILHESSSSSDESVDTEDSQGSKAAKVVMRQYSVGGWKHSADNKLEATSGTKGSKKAKSVHFSASKKLETKVKRPTQYAISTVRGEPAVRASGSRASNKPPMLGKYLNGRQQIDTSSTVVKDTAYDSVDDEDLDISSEEEQARAKKRIAENRARMVPGKRSMLQPGEVEQDTEDELDPDNPNSSWGDDSASSNKRTMSNDVNSESILKEDYHQLKKGKTEAHSNRTTPCEEVDSIAATSSAVQGTANSLHHRARRKNCMWTI